MTNAAWQARRWLLVLCHFAGPLLFFTNLTRNPYVTQIVLVHAAVGLALAAWACGEAARPDGWRWPRLPAAWPLLLFGAVWAASWLRAYWALPSFFRPSIAAEGARNGWFLVLICGATFLLSAVVSSEDDGTTDVPVGGWALFAVAWGMAWTLFPAARSRAAGRPEDLWRLVWDPFGAALWAAGLAGAGWLSRRARAADFLHLALCAGFLASAYGVIQYFNGEFLWPYTLNPYGGRAVSTFGNPNFLSTYCAALMPVALALFMTERTAGRRAAYVVLFLTLEAALLATLTRSSWLGAAVGCAALAFSPRLRARAAELPRALGLLAAAAVGLALLWPSSAISTGYTPTVVGRLTEFKTLLERDGSYSPFHQRLLIWTSAWLMGSETPALGKGGGLFELFYPFYQGHLMHLSGFYHNMRTHANNSHNEVLEVFAQTGILGLGAFAAFWAAFFESARRWARDRSVDEPAWAGAVAGCLGVLADNMLNVSLHFTVPAFLFWWLAGFSLGRGARGPARPARRLPAWAARAAAGAAVAAALLAAWTQARVWAREAWYFAGFKLTRAADLPRAQKALERSRAWGPREVNALYELGNVYARAGRFAEAATAYREALAANAGYDEIYFNLATVLSANLGRPDEALGFYQTSWAVNPLAQETVNALSAAYLRDPSRRLDDALEVLREATRDFPGNPAFWYNLGYALATAKRWPEAEGAFSRTLQISPDSAAAERSLAAVAAQSGRPPAPILGVLSDLKRLDAAAAKGDYSDGVVALAASAARRAPGTAKARFLHGSLLLARGRAQEAALELEAAVALEPSRPSQRINLAGAYAAMGRPADARAQLRAALALDPGNAAAQERLKALGD